MPLEESTRQRDTSRSPFDPAVEISFERLQQPDSTPSKTKKKPGRATANIRAPTYYCCAYPTTGSGSELKLTAKQSTHAFFSVLFHAQPAGFRLKYHADGISPTDPWIAIFFVGRPRAPAPHHWLLGPDTRACCGYVCGGSANHEPHGGLAFK